METELIGRYSNDVIAFPYLGIKLNIDNEAFSIFGFSIKWYGVMIAAGVLLAMIYCFKRAKRMGIDENRLIDAVIAGFIGAIIGARLYYCAMNPSQYKDIISILSIRDGGLAIYGGIIGALLFGLPMAKIRKLKIAPVLDLTAMGLLIGQCLGRWGNFFNQECFGTNTTLPWGMSGGRIQNYILAYGDSIAAKTGVEMNAYLPVHPCFLYESLWCLAGFLILHFYMKHRKFDGEMFLMYVVWYGMGRFFIEGLRTDSLYIGSIRVSQALALVSAVIALVLIIVMRIRGKKNPPVLYCDTEESKALLASAQQEESDYIEKKKNKKRKELTDEQKILADEDAEENGDTEITESTKAEAAVDESTENDRDKTAESKETQDTDGESADEDKTAENNEEE